MKERCLQCDYEMVMIWNEPTGRMSKCPKCEWENVVDYSKKEVPVDGSKTDENPDHT